MLKARAFFLAQHKLWYSCTETDKFSIFVFVKLEHGMCSLQKDLACRIMVDLMKLNKFK